MIVIEKSLKYSQSFLYPVICPFLGRNSIRPVSPTDALYYHSLVLPLPPIDVKAVSFTSTNTMNVTWSPPPLLYGEITGYKIIFEHQLEDGTWQTREVMTCSTQTTLTGLDINTEYRIKVAASTRKGFSPFSEFAYGGNYFNTNKKSVTFELISSLSFSWIFPDRLEGLPVYLFITLITVK